MGLGTKQPYVKLQCDDLIAVSKLYGISQPVSTSADETWYSVPSIPSRIPPGPPKDLVNS